MSARHLFRRGAISLTVSLSAFSPFAAHAETIRQVTEYSYDAVGRRVCTAVRMNAATFADSPSDACVLKAEGAQGPDRITKNIYDAAGQVVQVRQGVGTPLEQAYSTSVYSLNGAVTDIIDANGNRSQYGYDGFDRQIRWTFPSTTLPSSYNPSTPANALATAGSVNAADYEAYDYDANGNRTYWRRRETQSSTVRTIATTFDFLNRAATKTVSASGDSVATSYAYAYDNFGNMTSASEGGRTISSVYDALGRLTSETGPIGTVSYLYDAASRRSRLTWPSSAELRYEYDNADSVTTLKSSATATLVTYSYDDLGRRTSLSRGNGVATSYSYDPATLLLSSIGHTVGAGGASADNVTYSFLYNVAGQMTRRTISNNAYVWNGAYAVDRSYVSNGLNQYTAVGAASPTYDGRGNLKNDGATTWQYDLENRLRGTAAGASLIYDPLGRLYQTTTAAGTVTRYLYDGPNLIAEYSGANALLRRYAHGTGADEPIALFNGTSSTAEYLLSDHQGSVIAVTNSSGAVTGKLTYDEYGLPGASNAGLFQYTGQVYLSDLAIYHYKARAYSPTLGRFLQTDPTGYDDGLNWYAYVGNDPLNRSDPAGTQSMSLEAGREIADNQILRNCGNSADCVRTETNKLNQQEAKVANAQLTVITGAIAPLGAAAKMATTEPVVEGGNLVYQATSEAGKVLYVGITNNLERRAAEHLASKGIAIDAIPGLKNLSRADARAAEQALIQMHGLGKNGGTLMNVINSIAKKNPIFEAAVKRGSDILKNAGYPGF